MLLIDEGSHRMRIAVRTLCVPFGSSDENFSVLIGNVEAKMFRATRQIFDKSKTVQAANGVAQTVTMQTPLGAAGQAPLVPMQNKWIRRGYVLMNRGDMIGMQASLIERAADVYWAGAARMTIKSDRSVLD